MEENQEILFAKTLEKVKRLAREQGNSIRKEQVEEAFQVLALSKEQLAMVFEYLEKYHITIGESAAEEEDILSEEEIDYLEEYKKELLELPVFSDGEKDAFTSEELRRKVTVEELCTETGLSEKAVRDAMRLSGYTIEDIENPS